MVSHDKGKNVFETQQMQSSLAQREFCYPSLKDVVKPDSGIGYFRKVTNQIDQENLNFSMTNPYI